MHYSLVLCLVWISVLGYGVLRVWLGGVLGILGVCLALGTFCGVGIIQFLRVVLRFRVLLGNLGSGLAMVDFACFGFGLRACLTRCLASLPG